MDISDIRNQVRHRMFLGSRWQIHLERFRKQPATLFFKRPTIASLIRKTQITNLNNKWKMKITNLVTTNLTYSSNAFIGLFYCRFLLPWRHLLLSFIFIIIKISFLRFRSSHRKVERNMLSWSKCKTSNNRQKSLHIDLVEGCTRLCSKFPWGTS